MFEPDTPMDTTGPSAPADEPNPALGLILLSFMGTLGAAVWAILVIEILSSPQETPTDYFLISPHARIMYSALFIGFPVATVLSLCFLRRTNLTPTFFVVSGALFVTIGVLPALLSLPGIDLVPSWAAFLLVLIGAAVYYRQRGARIPPGLFIIAGALVAAGVLLRLLDEWWFVESTLGPASVPFSVILAGMLYGRERFPMRLTAEPEWADSIRAVPRTLRRVVVASALCVIAGYAIWALRPHQNAILVRAVQAGDMQGVLDALDAGAKLSYNPYYPNRPSALGSPLATAILAGQHEMYDFLIEQGTPLNDVAYQYDKTPLMCAASVGDAEIVRDLLERGIEDWHWSPEDTCAYEYAVEGGHTEAAALLEAAHAKAVRDEEEIEEVERQRDAEEESRSSVPEDRANSKD